MAGHPARSDCFDGMNNHRAGQHLSAALIRGQRYGDRLGHGVVRVLTPCQDGQSDDPPVEQGKPPPPGSNDVR